MQKMAQKKSKNELSKDENLSAHCREPQTLYAIARAYDLIRMMCWSKILMLNGIKPDRFSFCGEKVTVTPVIPDTENVIHKVEVYQTLTVLQENTTRDNKLFEPKIRSQIGLKVGMELKIPVKVAQHIAS